MIIKPSKEDREKIFDVVKEVPIPILGLAGMIETISSFGGTSYISAAKPVKLYDQIKFYVNTFTVSAVSASALYVYSNKINKWISSTAGIVG